MLSINFNTQTCQGSPRAAAPSPQLIFEGKALQTNKKLLDFVINCRPTTDKILTGSLFADVKEFAQNKVFSSSPLVVFLHRLTGRILVVVFIRVPFSLPLNKKVRDRTETQVS